MLNYPTRLLPQRNFKIIATNDSIRGHFLIHYTTTKDLKDPVTNKLKLDFVVRQTDHLRDYSNNLLGFFSVSDIYWELQNCPKKEYFKASWEVGTEVEIPIVPTHFIERMERGYFFLKIGDCHNISIPFEEGDGPTCIVLHTPTNSNFWHFSMRWLFHGEEMSNWTGSILKKMKTSGKAFIIEKAVLEEPEVLELDQSLFIS